MTSSLATNQLASVAALVDVRLNLGGRQILDGLTLDLTEGSKTALLGESSCGKSVALKTLVGLFAPQEGQVFLFGEELATTNRQTLTALRRRLGMQFQAGALFDSTSVRLNLVMASEESFRGDGRKKTALSEAIIDLLNQVGLKEAAELFPASLSGGMRKRVALARVLIGDPELAIFDEPTAGLDPQTSSRIINLLNDLAQKSQAAMILATTDPDVARRFTENILLMKDGRIYAQGSLKTLKELGDPYIDHYFSRLPKTEKS
ncbi:MAG: ATP-binding cassette domain-containing protein [Deltaproteobacteria bacterium]|jgi:phospholipid/cholesterol/gamma-HCH transport system ATP-binding protein|nr:ATP-binding cassette domain-containing protein [Deltaproteobacteria bacterium]